MDMARAEKFAFCVANFMQSSATTEINHTVDHTSPFVALQIGGDSVENGFIFFLTVFLVENKMSPY